MAFPKVKISSAKRRWWMAGLFVEIFKPLILPRASSLNSNLERTSEPRINRKGDRGSPCLRPLLEENKPKGLPLIRMEKEEEEMHNLIQVIQEERKPNCFITERINSYFILSKSFFMSKLRNMKPPSFFCFWWSAAVHGLEWYCLERF